VPLDRFERVVDEVERAFVGEARPRRSGKPAPSLASGPVLLLTGPEKRHVVGLAHVEVQVDRVDRDERGQQSGRVRTCPAARDQIAIETR